MTDPDPADADRITITQSDEEFDDDSVITFDPPVEPGTPSLENALFVLLGVAVALAVVIRLVQLFG